MKRYSLVVSPQPDLLSLYRSSGFVVHSHPVEDPAHAAAYERAGILEQMQALKTTVLSEYRSRVGAMLMHCSGGMDRAAPVAAFIAVGPRVADRFDFSAAICAHSARIDAAEPYEKYQLNERSHGKIVSQQISHLP
jgi:Cyclin-dependent kinase inhibitor 3 (CDKN3)